MPNSLNSIEDGPFFQLRNRFDKVLEDGGNRVFADLSGGIVTYAELLREMNQLDSAFQDIGLSVGDRAAIFSKNERAVIVLFLSLLRSGYTPVIGDGDATATEFKECLEVCQPAIVFADTSLSSTPSIEQTVSSSRIVQIDQEPKTTTSKAKFSLSQLFNIPENPERRQITEPPELAMLVFTSGTTSMPKAVELTHGNLVAQLRIFSEVYLFNSDTKLLNLLPLHHVDGIIRGPLTALWFQGSIHRPIPFSVQNTPRILSSIAAKRLTHFISVPAMLNIIERVGRTESDTFQTPSFKFVISSADLLTEQLWKRVEQTFNIPVVNAYGLSEVVCDALFAGPDQETRKIGSIGIPVGCEAAILDNSGKSVAIGEVGELTISGPTVMRGYFNDEELTKQVIKGGNFHTGDLVRQREDGIYEFVGRKKTAIVSAGVTINPEAVTKVVCEIPGVAEAIVFGVDDANRNQRLVAAIVPETGRTISSTEAAAYCREHLSSERRPSEFHILDALPRTASGKVQMKELTSLASMKHADLPEKDVLSIAASCFGVLKEGLSANSTPFNTEGWDSLAHMTLIEELELQFEIMFSAHQIAQISSLGDAIEFVDEARREKQKLASSSHHIIF
ncbi:MAG: AMP-binding protein [Sneathiella sp.]|nr:AMP-binding protein [Sneathiella sp.]